MTRGQWIVIVFAVVMTVGLGAVYMSMRDAQERPGVQRRTAQALLQEHARLLRAYREAHDGAWPEDLIALRGFSRRLDDASERLGFASNHVPGTPVFYRYRPPPDPGAHHIVLASDHPNRAVAAGEEYGGKDEVTTRDRPAVHYVLDARLQVLALDPETHRQRAAWVYRDEEAETPRAGGRDEWGEWQ